jgi:hypothetical protein
MVVPVAVLDPQLTNIAYDTNPIDTSSPQSTPLITPQVTQPTLISTTQFVHTTSGRLLGTTRCTGTYTPCIPHQPVLIPSSFDAQICELSLEDFEVIWDLDEHIIADNAVKNTLTDSYQMSIAFQVEGDDGEGNGEVQNAIVGGSSLNFPSYSNASDDLIVHQGFTPFSMGGDFEGFCGENEGGNENKVEKNENAKNGGMVEPSYYQSYYNTLNSKLEPGESYQQCFIDQKNNFFGNCDNFEQNIDNNNNNFGYTSQTGPYSTASNKWSRHQNIFNSVINEIQKKPPSHQTAKTKRNSQTNPKTTHPLSTPHPSPQTPNSTTFNTFSGLPSMELGPVMGNFQQVPGSFTDMLNGDLSSFPGIGGGMNEGLLGGVADIAMNQISGIFGSFDTTKWANGYSPPNSLINKSDRSFNAVSGPQGMIEQLQLDKFSASQRLNLEQKLQNNSQLLNINQNSHTSTQSNQKSPFQTLGGTGSEAKTAFVSLRTRPLSSITTATQALVTPCRGYIKSQLVPDDIFSGGENIMLGKDFLNRKRAGENGNGDVKVNLFNFGEKSDDFFVGKNLNEPLMDLGLVLSERLMYVVERLYFYDRESVSHCLRGGDGDFFGGREEKNEGKNCRRKLTIPSNLLTRYDYYNALDLIITSRDKKLINNFLGVENYHKNNPTNGGNFPIFTTESNLYRLYDQMSPNLQHHLNRTILHSIYTVFNYIEKIEKFETELNSGKKSNFDNNFFDDIFSSKQFQHSIVLIDSMLNTLSLLLQSTSVLPQHINGYDPGVYIDRDNHCHYKDENVFEIFPSNNNGNTNNNDGSNIKNNNKIKNVHNLNQIKNFKTLKVDETGSKSTQNTDFRVNSRIFEQLHQFDVNIRPIHGVINDEKSEEILGEKKNSKKRASFNHFDQSGIKNGDSGRFAAENSDNSFGGYDSQVRLYNIYKDHSKNKKKIDERSEKNDEKNDEKNELLFQELISTIRKGSNPTKELKTSITGTVGHGRLFTNGNSIIKDAKLFLEKEKISKNFQNKNDRNDKKIDKKIKNEKNMEKLSSSFYEKYLQIRPKEMALGDNLVSMPRDVIGDGDIADSKFNATTFSVKKISTFFNQNENRKIKKNKNQNDERNSANILPIYSKNDFQYQLDQYSKRLQSILYHFKHPNTQSTQKIQDKTPHFENLTHNFFTSQTTTIDTNPNASSLTSSCTLTINTVSLLPTCLTSKSTYPIPLNLTKTLETAQYQDYIPKNDESNQNDDDFIEWDGNGSVSEPYIPPNIIIPNPDDVDFVMDGVVIDPPESNRGTTSPITPLSFKASRRGNGVLKPMDKNAKQNTHNILGKKMHKYTTFQIPSTPSPNGNFQQPLFGLSKSLPNQWSSTNNGINTGSPTPSNSNFWITEGMTNLNYNMDYATLNTYPYVIGQQVIRNYSGAEQFTSIRASKRIFMSFLFRLSIGFQPAVTIGTPGLPRFRLAPFANIASAILGPIIDAILGAGFPDLPGLIDANTGIGLDAVTLEFPVSWATQRVITEDHEVVISTVLATPINMALVSRCVAHVGRTNVPFELAVTRDVYVPAGVFGSTQGALIAYDYRVPGIYEGANLGNLENIADLI